RYCGLRQPTSTRRSPSASPPAHPQWWHSHVPFSTFTDRQRACFFFRVGEHSGHVTSTSPDAPAGSWIPKSLNVFAFTPPPHDFVPATPLRDTPEPLPDPCSGISRSCREPTACPSHESPG